MLSLLTAMAPDQEERHEHKCRCRSPIGERPCRGLISDQFDERISQAPAYPLIPRSVPASEGKESGKPRTVKPRDIAAVA